jgi:hypothetical protein
MKKSRKQIDIPECFVADLDMFSAVLDAIIAEAKPVLPMARVADLEHAKLAINALRKHRAKNP